MPVSLASTSKGQADQQAGFERYRRPAKRGVFLATMEEIVPWRLCAVVGPHHPKAGDGRPPIGLERMLRMYFMQRWLNLADDACEEALLDSTALRRLVGIDLGRDRVPGGTKSATCSAWPLHAAPYRMAAPSTACFIPRP